MNQYLSLNKALCIFFYIISFNLFAQEKPLELKRQCKVYFSPNSSTLSKEAIETIRNFLANEEEESYSEFRLQAFSDDVGTKEANEILAQERYQTVQFFLIEEGLENTQIKTKPFQQIPLDPTKNASEQRKENRRVVIEQWASTSIAVQEKLADNEPNENALYDFFNKNRAKAIQEFSFNAAEGSVLEGEKGTMLYIPQNCFIDKNGNTYAGKVNFSLSEAYSYGDLIMQNLATVSNNKMLETGGSFYIAALDENGDALDIKSDMQITAALPSKEAKKSDMQTFEGQTDSSGFVNWVPTQQSIQTAPGLWTGNGQGNSNSIAYTSTQLYQSSNIQESLEVLAKTPIWSQKMPRQMDKPIFRLRMPKFPKLQTNTKPNKLELKAIYVQKTNESNKNYAHRINNIYRSLNQKYLHILQNNKSKIAAYKSDSVEYSRGLAKHNQNMEKYMVYNNQMRAVLNEMYQNIIQFDINEYASAHDDLSDFFEKIGNANFLIKASFDNIALQTKEYAAQKYDMDIVLKKIQETKMSVLSPNECEQLEKSWNKMNPSYFKSKFFKAYNAGIHRLNAQKRYLVRIKEQIPNEGLIKPSRLRQIQQQKEKIKENYDFAWISKTNTAAQKVYQKRKKSIDAFIQLEASIDELQKLFFKRKNELGILTPQEIVQVYGNALGIKSLGWINCDRFYNSKDLKMNLEIVVEHSYNTTIYVIFEDIKCLMPTFPQADKKSYITQNIPQNQEVKIVGLRILGNEAEFFEEIGTVKQLNKIKPVFKRKNLKQVEALMTAI